MKYLTVIALTAFITLAAFITPDQKRVAPEIALKNPAGEVMKLSDLQGNVVLVDFWASWCRPCRVKHPDLVSVYNEFKDARFKNAKGFDIYSVSLDKNMEAWKNAIKQDKLTWDSHVSDLKGWQNSAAQTYGVRSIPTNLLLNEKGEIVATNLHGDRLREALKKMQ